ncbi:MAG: TlpA family protein disulfide reductase [Dehalococcoidia bacterium]|uniref:TlpA disulfide reductase family protein n=1 Tax=Candidatus Amarobacter glycogenicus TaxID=3140699 RepID=UPI0031346848|nr:TlpA family protein disulfide reductase [Dehalococcoidia bacterium]
MIDSHPDERPQRRREYSGPGSTLGLAAAIVVAVAAAIWYFEFRDSGDGSSAMGAGSGFGIIELEDGLNPTTKSPAAREGRAAPNFRLPRLGEEAVTLVDYRGSFVLLNFWASWCGPCRDETPDLQSFHEHHSQDGLVIIGVNQQEQRAAAADFVDEFGVTYTVALDASGEVSAAYGVGRGMPISFLVSPGGVIEQVYFGRLTETQFAELEARLP